MTGKRRQTAGFDLTERARRAVDRYHEETGIPKSRIVENVMAFFADQEYPVKRVMMRDVDYQLRGEYAVFLETIARRVREGVYSPHAQISGLADPPDVGRGHLSPEDLR